MRYDLGKGYGLDFGGCEILFSSRDPLVDDTAFSGLNLLYPIYIGASTISTNIGTIPCFDICD